MRQGRATNEKEHGQHPNNFRLNTEISDLENYHSNKLPVGYSNEFEAQRDVAGFNIDASQNSLLRSKETINSQRNQHEKKRPPPLLLSESSQDFDAAPKTARERYNNVLTSDDSANRLKMHKKRRPSESKHRRKGKQRGGEIHSNQNFLTAPNRKSTAKALPLGLLSPPNGLLGPSDGKGFGRPKQQQYSGNILSPEKLYHTTQNQQRIVEQQVSRRNQIYNDQHRIMQKLTLQQKQGCCCGSSAAEACAIF